MTSLDGTVSRRLDELESLADTPSLTPALRQGIAGLLAEYSGGYARLRRHLIDASASGRPYPLFFDAYFAESSRVLDLAAGLSAAAGDANRTYWLDTGLSTLRAAIVACAIGLVALAAAALAATVERIAEGDLDAPAPTGRLPTEIARIRVTVEALRARLAEARAQETRAASDRAAKGRRQQATERFTADFSAVIGGVLGQLGGSARRMRDDADTMATLAASTRTEAAAVAVAIDAGVAALDAAAHLTSAAESVTGSVRHATLQVAAAVEQVADSERLVHGLSGAAAESGAVVETIRSIAARTKLLALNATIEAGKGFAVVAGELNALAVQTAQATDDVARRIAAVQASSGAAAGSIGRIAGAVAELRTAAGLIADGIDAQAGEIIAISDRLDDASRSNEEVLGRMRALSETASAGGGPSEGVLATCDEVGTRAEGLRIEVDGFLASPDRAGDRRRFDRVPLDLPCRAEWPGGARATRLRDLSRGGARLADDLGLPVRTELRLAIADGPALPARIARVEDGATGLLFVATATTDAELTRLLAGHEALAA